MVDKNHICRNEQSTIDIFEKHKGEFVIINNKVMQFVAIALDYSGYLYIMYDGRKIYYHTILEPLVILKGKIDDKDYNEIVRIARLNFYSSYSVCNDKGVSYDLVKLSKNHCVLLEDYATQLKEGQDEKWRNELLSDFEWSLEYNGKGISPEKEKQWPQ